MRHYSRGAEFKKGIVFAREIICGDALVIITVHEGDLTNLCELSSAPEYKRRMKLTENILPPGVFIRVIAPRRFFRLRGRSLREFMRAIKEAASVYNELLKEWKELGFWKNLAVELDEEGLPVLLDISDDSTDSTDSTNFTSTD